MLMFFQHLVNFGLNSLKRKAICLTWNGKKRIIGMYIFVFTSIQKCSAIISALYLNIIHSCSWLDAAVNSVDSTFDGGFETTWNCSIFTARCYASAVLAMGLCPSVCLSVSVCHKPVFY